MAIILNEYDISMKLIVIPFLNQRWYRGG